MEKGQELYLVTREEWGYYEDYPHIEVVGAYSSEDKAEAAIDKKIRDWPDLYKRSHFDIEHTYLDVDL